MAYKTILVHLDAGERCAARVEAAVQLACRHDSHLIGLNALSVNELSDYVLTGAGSAPLIEFRKRAAAEQAARAEAVFARAVTLAGLTKTEWRTSTRDAVDAVTLHARYADLLVLGQPEAPRTSGVAAGFAEYVTLAAGRPVLMIPRAGSFATIGRRVLVGWNASREATRAITDAIPLLQQADVVQILAFNPRPDEHGALPGADIGLYLARHGVRVDVKVDHTKDIDVGNELLSRAADLDADLMVMGAYGHSRLKELVMGGASRTVIDTMTMPVMLSH
ncbi:MAG: universal stress protein [Burkholderiales bacterium]